MEIFYFFILPPLQSAAWGGRTTRPATHQPPLYADIHTDM